MSDEIVIVEYDPAWPAEFVRLRDRAEEECHSTHLRN
jgi:GrpB-like predicted nucleotidyltransferase (UPF0157 family)